MKYSLSRYDRISETPCYEGTSVLPSASLFHEIAFTNETNSYHVN